MAVSRVTGIPQSTMLSIIILVIVCAVYTGAVYFGMKGVQWSASCCIYLFFALLAYVFFFGGETRYIVETGISALGNLTQNFISMATWTDALRTSSFPQSWTIFYWAYWMVWCVATPFFIGSISRGRTIKQVILGGYGFGLAGTFTSFIILGNYGLGLQMHGRLDILAQYSASGDLYSSIISILEQLPFSGFVLVLLVLCMVTFYSTSFDSITMVAASYSYKELKPDEEPDRNVKLFWDSAAGGIDFLGEFHDKSPDSVDYSSISGGNYYGFDCVEFLKRRERVSEWKLIYPLIMATVLQHPLQK
jgi:BCCT family betaine/carnitine transporter